MKVIAVDTSTNVASCAIMDDEKLLGECLVNDSVTHSQKLLPLISDMLNHCKLNIKDIDVFAVANGPGSFTGLRIGVATINSLAQAVEKPVVGVSSLESLAGNISISEKLIVPMIDARRERVFTAIYSFRDSKKTHRNPEAIEVEELLNMLDEKQEDIVFVGQGADVYRENIKQILGSRAYFTDKNINISRASSVAKIAIEKAKNGETKSYFELTPDYLRESQAQREYDEKMRNKKC